MCLFDRSFGHPGLHLCAGAEDDLGSDHDRPFEISDLSLKSPRYSPLEAAFKRFKAGFKTFVATLGKENGGFECSRGSILPQERLFS